MKFLRSILVFLAVPLVAFGQAGSVKYNTATNALIAPTASQFRAGNGLVIGTNVEAWDADLDLWSAITPATGIGTFLATPSSANLAAAVTNETGTGALVFGTSPTIASPSITSLSATGNGEHAFRVTTGSYVDNVGYVRNDTGDGMTTFGYSALRYLYGTSSGKGGTEGAAVGLDNGAAFGGGLYLETSAPSGTAPPFTLCQSGDYGGSAYAHWRLNIATGGTIKIFGIDPNNTTPATETVNIGSSATTRTLRLNPNGGFGVNIAPDPAFDLEVGGNVRFRSLQYLGTSGALFNGAGNHGTGVEIVTAGTLFATDITNGSMAKVSKWGGLGYDNSIGTFFRFYTTGTGNDFDAYLGDTGDVLDWHFYTNGTEYFKLDGACYVLNSNLYIANAGFGLAIKEGANCKQGTATLASGAVTVSTTAVTSNSRIFVTRRSVNSSTAIGNVSVTTVTGGTSFVITALKGDTTTETNDVSVVSWLITEPAP